MMTSGWQNVVKFIHFIFKEGENNKCYVKVYIPFLLEEHSKGNWAFKGHSGTWKLVHSRHLNTWELKALGHSKGTEVLRHSDTSTFELLNALYLADSKNFACGALIFTYSQLFSLIFTLS